MIDISSSADLIDVFDDRFCRIVNSMRLSLLSLFIIIGGILVGCNGDSNDGGVAMKPRPVTVLKLEERDFTSSTRLTGSVSLYREEQVGLEVEGRLLWVLEVGKEVEGPVLDENGKLIRPGEPIAKLDDTRYQLRVNELKARLNASKHRLYDVRAELKLARQTLDRQKRVFEEGAGSRQAVENAQSNYSKSVANNDQRNSVIREIEETLHRAEKDLADCKLLAPFSGRITKVHVSQGAVVKDGQPIITLSLMDPIQVEVAVSADQDRRIQTGNRAILYPKDPINPDGKPTQVNAIVYEKGAVAELDTRTFRINLIARNERRQIHQIVPETKGLPVVIDYLPVVRRRKGEVGNLFVHGNSIFHEDGKTYVFRLPGVSFHPGAKRSAVGKHVPEKIEVTLGDEYFTVIKWNFRSLQANANLREGDFLVIEPRKEHLDGLAIGRAQWLMRPGDLVPVRFQLDAIKKGLYVPMHAITIIDDKQVVFLLEEDQARMREVTIHETYQELRRIEGQGIVNGAQVIISGVHYVSDGQPVTIVGEENLTR